MDLRIGRRGVSSVVGMALMLITLILFIALTYNVLNIINEFSNLNLDSIERVLVRIRIHYSVGGSYLILNSTSILKIHNNLTEPLQVIGFVIVYRNMSYEIVRLNDEYLIPPLSTTSLSLDTRDEPLYIVAVILVRDIVTHVVLKGI